MVRFYGVAFSLKWLYSNILLCSLWWRMICKYQCLKEGIEVECVISYVINLHNKWWWSNLEAQFNWTKWSLKISTSCVCKKVFLANVTVCLKFWCSLKSTSWRNDLVSYVWTWLRFYSLTKLRCFSYVIRSAGSPKRVVSIRAISGKIFLSMSKISCFSFFNYLFFLNLKWRGGPEERVALNPVYC